LVYNITKNLTSENYKRIPLTYIMKGSVKEPNVSVHFFFPPINQWYSISYVLFTGGRGLSDFSVLKYY